MKIGEFKEYKGYVGSIDISEDCHHGKLLGVRDLVNYEADSLPQLYEEFHRAVDDYINTLKELKWYDKMK